MIDDSIVNEIREYRQEHAKKYDNDLNKIFMALKKREKESGKIIIDRSPRLLLAKTGS
jgi:hypothetical protein